MKRTLGPVVLVVVMVLALAPAPSDAAAPDGRQVFLAQKCNLCHSVSTADIAATTKSEKMKGPDLVGVAHDAQLLMQYLRREAEIEGKKHGKGFTGSDEELGALIAWIRAQKKQ
jgi:mono/diheme cytochrome c family protein